MVDLASVPDADIFAEAERRSPAAPARLLSKLSPREREVFDFAANGIGNVEIAKRLGLRRGTVETHRANINRRLGLHSPVELVRFAVAAGVIAADGATS